MLLTGPFAMLSMPSFDFHLPPCTEGFLIHLSPLWQLPLWQLPLFPSVAQLYVVARITTRRSKELRDAVQLSHNLGGNVQRMYYAERLHPQNGGCGEKNVNHLYSTLS